MQSANDETHFEFAIVYNSTNGTCAGFQGLIATESIPETSFVGLSPLAKEEMSKMPT